MDIYVSNQWTHGFLDTQQKNISLVYSAEIFSIKALGVILKLRSSTGGGRGVSKTYENLRWGGGGHTKNLRSFFM